MALRREGGLARVLEEAGLLSNEARPPLPPRVGALSAGVRLQIQRLFAELGGTTDLDTLRPGAWDLVLADGRVLEFDEQSHFNRYRAVTCATQFAASLPWTSVWAQFCRERESRAVRGAGYWANASSDWMFGGSDAPGVFADHGSSRWKQRAIYDAIKDAAAADGIVTLVRLSIYDEIDGVVLEDALLGRAALDERAMVELLDVRTSGQARRSQDRPSSAARETMPMDEVLATLRAFVAERDWAQFHTAPNLAKGVSIEAAELLECYQWSDDADDARVREELADVLTYCLLLADRIGADPAELVLTKLEQTKRKYPVALAKGDITKHDRR